MKTIHKRAVRKYWSVGVIGFAALLLPLWVSAQTTRDGHRHLGSDNRGLVRIAGIGYSDDRRLYRGRRYADLVPVLYW